MFAPARIPLLFLSLGSLLGLFLRWQFISPTPGVNYIFFLHGHSHVMFLGWIFNALYLSFVSDQPVLTKKRSVTVGFSVMQVLVFGMLIAFPLQGYGFYSILFSTLHTLVAVIFVVQFFIATRGARNISVWFARTALGFFVISTLGPFSLGYLMANHMGQTKWYYFAIYFYLHFQYNGFFFFGVLSVLLKLLHEKKIVFDYDNMKAVGRLFATFCVPAYLLSVLWVDTGTVSNMIGALAAIGQFIAVVLLFRLVRGRYTSIRQALSAESRTCLAFASTALIMKLVLQLLSAFPDIARMAYDQRPIVIAYLHLVLVGMISVCLLVWYFENNLTNRELSRYAIGIFLFSFAGMEICLVLTPWWNKLFNPGISTAQWTFVFSIGLAVSCLMFYVSSFGKNLTKISI